jgi:hypothetical protein
MIYAPETPRQAIPATERVVTAKDLIDPMHVVTVPIAAGGMLVVGALEAEGIGIVSDTLAPAYDPEQSFSGFEGFVPETSDSGPIVANTVEAAQLGELFAGFIGFVGVTATVLLSVNRVGGVKNTAALVMGLFKRRSNRPVVTRPL